MKDVSCEVIRDLLPLYEDDVVSEETAELVREHLKDCPACREELRKMRTPISMPPDGDEEAVKRFLEHRAEVRRKQNKKLICILAPLALVLVFCLCYALIPRNWESVGGGQEPDWIMGSYSVFTFESGEPVIDTWVMNNQRDSGVVGSILDVLESAAYRAELGNLLNYTPFGFEPGGTTGLKGAVALYFVADNEVAIDVMLRGSAKDCEVSIYPGNSDVFVYHTKAEVYDKMASLLAKYGEKQ